MKTNAQQTEEEFRYTLACKKMLHEMEICLLYLDEAKSVGMQGISRGAISTVESRIYDLKAALYNALKTV